MKSIANLSFEDVLQHTDMTFSGWDFSLLEKTGRMQEFPLRWNYYNIVEQALRKSTSILDMGTGGGEFLSRLSNLPAHTCATEGYEPNVEVARQRLEPLGVAVSFITDDKRLPYADREFDLIINRHESYSPQEVHRILKPGGWFITQQVGDHNDQEFNELLQAPNDEFAHWNLEYAVQELEPFFEIAEKDEEITRSRFFDLGAIVFYLSVIPWQIPDFSVNKYETKLRLLYQMLEQKGFMDTSCHRFIIAARKKI
ncbi:class I SAM-dependent methyltransferase [Paenibacillus sp. KQZ6P-2]|uniref:Class I SAM-dependent methyltransferase n=1 Tax=Paenibacillus mangrovi TaxID=2931978 RepID=A0A9X2B3U0_9BACL|nr:class I SAM-dependent methyltransferase [Paenibacillus mangrovi]MCJ8010922.1 class I SAM-dependent methyltransferase [Paenibacillus mangrovi]